MPQKIPLSGGSYTARSVISDAQACINMFPEKNQQTSELPFVYYPTPGLVKFAQGPFGAVRGLYEASNNNVYAVIDNGFYELSSGGALTLRGNITPGSSPVRFVDNTFEIVIFDGTSNGWYMDLTTNTFAAISDPAWYGSVGGGYLDSFMVFNRPGTRDWYATESNQFLPLNPLYFARKTAAGDLLRTVTVRDRSILLLGENSLEFWFNSGNESFPFAIQAGAFEDIGIAAPYSLAQFSGTSFWLSKNLAGDSLAVSCTEYRVDRVSNYAIEAEWKTYTTVEDAIGFVYQSGGHVFYVLNFPTANRTWVYDAQENLWHRRAYLESDGTFSRHRANCHVYAFGRQLVGDYQNGAIYDMSDSAYTDDGTAIRRVRGFPTISADQRRISYLRFALEMEVGSAPLGVVPTVEMRYSDNYGRTWSDYLHQSLGETGEFNRSVVWNRLGLGRNRVFEVSWSFNGPTALKGAFVEMEVSET
jgi:hypothetical protein